jgi:hypothetical protein
MSAKEKIAHYYFSFYITLSFFSSFTLVNFLLIGILFILLPQLLKKWIVPICFMFFLKYLKSPP